MYTCYSTKFGSGNGKSYNKKSRAEAALRELKWSYLWGHNNLFKFDEVREVKSRQEAKDLADPRIYKTLTECPTVKEFKTIWSLHESFDPYHLTKDVIVGILLTNKPPKDQPKEQPKQEMPENVTQFETLINLELLSKEVSKHFSVDQFKEEITNQVSEIKSTLVKDTVESFEDKNTKAVAKASLAVEDAINARLKNEIHKSIEERVPKRILVKIEDLPEKEIEGHVHQKFEQVLNLANMRENILLVGPAGSGKTTLAKQVSEMLELPFFAISLSGGTSESAFKGRYVPTGENGKFEFMASEFIHRYENGGVVLLDEMDACDENVLVSINTALDNGYLDLPDRSDKPVAERHKDFVCIASANTYGQGANRIYCGRNQLDGATLDRFLAGLIEMDYDHELERKLVLNDSFRESMWQLREKVNKKKLRRIVSTRVAIKLDNQIAAGFLTPQEGIQQITAGWSQDELAAVK